MRPHVFVVEGKNDQRKLETIFDAPIVITTNGSAVDQDAITLLKKLDETHDIILLLDPDHAGARIRRLVSKELKHVFHAFVNREEAISKNERKVGIEHASKEDILKALSNIKVVIEHQVSDVTYPFLYEMKLLGHHESSHRRQTIAHALGIGHVNGKTFYQRLHMFGIKQNDILEVINESSDEKKVWTKLSQR